MNINWGHKIILVFVLFVSLIATLVYKSIHTNFELVTKEYYKDELVYQQVIDGTNNANKLGGITTVSSDAQFVNVTLPEEMKKSCGQKTCPNMINFASGILNRKSGLPFT